MAAPPRFDPETGEWIYPDEDEYPKEGYDQASGAPPGYQVPTPDLSAPPGKQSFWDLFAPQPPPVGPGPGPSPGPSPGPGRGDFSIAGGKKFFEYPDWTPPAINWGAWTPPSWDVQPFEYEGFEGPTAETFQTDPGYEFRVDEMDRALRNARSPMGLLATGGTMTDLMKMRGGLASQEFGNVWNRQHQAYQTNRANAADIWQKGYMGESDEYTRGLTDYLTQEESKSRQWDRSRDLYTTNLGKEMGGYGLNLDTSRLGLADRSSQFGNLLSLATLMMQGRPTFNSSV